MNKKAKEIGCKGTHYANPHGFQDANHYTTAKDTYLISKYAMTDKTVGDTLSTIVRTTSYTFRTNKQYYALTNRNSLLLSGTYYNKYCRGIKTGSTSDAGDCLTSYATNGSMTYYCVVLGCKQVEYGCLDDKNSAAGSAEIRLRPGEKRAEDMHGGCDAR
jgi:D-alanyl-D-alanine carboxypeptidase (penicillin-binding protein 5/6)